MYRIRFLRSRCEHCCIIIDVSQRESSFKIFNVSFYLEYCLIYDVFSTLFTEYRILSREANLLEIKLKSRSGLSV